MRRPVHPILRLWAGIDVLPNGCWLWRSAKPSSYPKIHVGDRREPVTQAENIRRGRAGAHFRERTHCRQGHPFDEQNTRIAGGRRWCRACERDRATRERERLHRLAVERPELIPHGTHAGYKKWGCRCELCRSTYRKGPPDAT